ncbi:MAG: class I SAM-dependent methyltransferase [Deinococcaceae bacterium]
MILELPKDLDVRLAQAYERRHVLHDDPKTTFYRLVHHGDQIPGITLDRADTVGILSLYDACSPEAEHLLCEVISQTMGLQSIYLKRRPKEARHKANTDRDWLCPPTPHLGPEVPEVAVLENGLRYLIRPGQDLSVGLFGDMRPTRAWFQVHAQGRILNTFAYTCAFGVCAQENGTEVKNLDASRKVLNWGMENYTINGFTPNATDFISGDVFDWLGRWSKRGETFDTIILDPPSFARSKRQTFRVEHDYGDLIGLACKCLSKGGTLVVSTNHSQVSAAQLVSHVRATGRHARELTRFGAGIDYPSEQTSHLKVLVFKL